MASCSAGAARIEAPAVTPNVTMTVPGSKSITNRALLLAALANGPSQLTGVLFADDTERMLACLDSLGIALEVDRAAHRVRVQGQGGHWPAASADLYIGNAGTAARFLTAACALAGGPYRLDGNARMRQRPLGPLLAALRQLGADVTDELGTGCPPVVIKGPLHSGRVELDAGLSSQFLSALLHVLPLLDGDSVISLAGGLPAWPYVEMTIRMMAQFGIEQLPEPAGTNVIVPGTQRYRGQVYAIEPDASSASYFFAAAALLGGTVRIEGIGSESLQGDAAFVEILSDMGCQVEREPMATTVSAPPDGRLGGVDVDLNTMSDMTMTLAVLAPFADAPVRIRNVGHIRVQESDRLSALTTELSKLGIRVEEGADELVIYPGQPRPARVNTYDDHRLAMAFSVLALRVPGLEIADPGCVAKTFPDFFEHLALLGAKVNFGD